MVRGPEFVYGELPDMDRVRVERRPSSGAEKVTVDRRKFVSERDELTAIASALREARRMA